MTGVITQDVEKILPDAVSKSGPCTLSNGEEIDNVLIVDKDRIFLGNAQNASLWRGTVNKSLDILMSFEPRAVCIF